MPYQLNRQPDFARLRKALLCEGEPDLVPNLELGVHPCHKSEILGRPCASVSDEIEFARRAAYDYIKIQPRIPMAPRFAKGHSEASAGFNWAAEGGGAIASMEDFERFPWPKLSEIGYERFEEAVKLVPDDMMIIAQYGDIFTFVWEAMGFENFSMALYDEDDIEIVEALFARVGEIVTASLETMAQSTKVGALWYSDDLAYITGLMVNPKIYRQYLFPWVRKIGDLAKARNIPFLYHTDGLLYDVIPDLLDCGVTSLHPIEPQAMDPAEVKNRFADRKLAAVGSIEVDTLCRGSVADVQALVRDRLKRVAPGGGYCLGSGNSVPHYAKFENYWAMLEAGEKWGAYPISL